MSSNANSVLDQQQLGVHCCLGLRAVPPTPFRQLAPSLFKHQLGASANLCKVTLLFWTLVFVYSKLHSLLTSYPLSAGNYPVLYVLMPYLALSSGRSLEQSSRGFVRAALRLFSFTPRQPRSAFFALPGQPKVVSNYIPGRSPCGAKFSGSPFMAFLRNFRSANFN